MKYGEGNFINGDQYSERKGGVIVDMDTIKRRTKLPLFAVMEKQITGELTAHLMCQNFRQETIRNLPVKNVFAVEGSLEPSTTTKYSSSSGKLSYSGQTFLYRFLI